MPQLLDEARTQQAPETKKEMDRLGIITTRDIMLEKIDKWHENLHRASPLCPAWILYPCIIPSYVPGSSTDRYRGMCLLCSFFAFMVRWA